MDVDDPVAVYLREVGTIAPLTRERELECIRHIRARDEQAEHARKDLVEANLAMVVSIVQQHPIDKIHILDLIVEGNNSLLAAVQPFADSNTDDFAVFAAPYIERAIRDAVGT